ncbi:hypothetical protein [Dyella sp.]|uniref:hypothetical protein n=1 Tax=Dyella sp. TaxID=1869338 RepID=UPI00283DBFFD|nr:hypothetical protein [Dyella sp.]MDR3445739.1 hypothetical protein [Dyella sp.]
MHSFILALLMAPFQIIHPSVTLASGPNDDMRPQIVGDVVSADAGQVELDGGALVPVQGARVRPGDHATFACDSIDTTTPTPRMRGCVLLQAEKPSAKPKNELW